MSVQLLDKTRKINKLLHNNNSSKVVFNDICSVLSDILESNVLVISKKGKVLGISQYHGVDEIHELIVDRVGGLIDPLLNERLLGILSTKENVNLQTLGFEFENIRKYQALVAPIDIAGERLGTLFLYKYEKDYEIDDIILSEYGTTVVGLEMMRSVHEENAEEIRKRQIVQSAISTLSFSELEAIIHNGYLNSRYKDFYDIYVLSKKYEFSYAELRNAVIQTFENRKTPMTMDSAAFSDEFLNDPMHQTRWKAFLKKKKALIQVSMSDAMDWIKAFVRPLFEGAKKTRWNHEKGIWE